MTKDMSIRMLYLLISLLFIVFSIYLVINYLFPLFLGCLFALILYPLVKALSNRLNIPHVVSCLLAILFAICLLLFVFVFIGMELLQGIMYLAKWIPQNIQFLIDAFVQQFNLWIQPLLERLDLFIHSLPNQPHTIMEDKLSEISQNAADQLGAFLEMLLNWTGNQLASLPGSLTVLIFSFLCTFFICKDWMRFSHFLAETMPISLVELSFTISQHVKEKVIKYVKAQLILIAMTFVIILLGLLIFRVQHALTIAFIMAIVDLLPVIGTGLIFVPWSLYLFMTGQTGLAICLFSLYLVVLLQRQLAEPKLIANALGVHPILTILAIYLGFQLFGVKGIWIAPAILFIGKACIEAKLFSLIWNYIKYNHLNVDKP
ncbi:sporulation integral membrane protein YtvI [Gracilibacillus caseinilyticus]|uniref:Sporulation integral membrane protein YtvI n=1 Tax=Gracilibacillus caseinilyticus TaxID=2932256 RepID=A0ABY4ERV4_9BACI|nr:sporulation integral membrane protein YtvI [Gracilibacillus caseinilyticus]UOQ47166.1 sporulation integral membrane protein YtvI [Gracilibacillus caseinilyticus]